MCEKLVGSWKMVKSEDFEAFLKAIGMDGPTRKIVSSVKSDVMISKNAEEMCIKTVSTFKNTDLVFKVNEEFDETTADKRKCKTTFTEHDGKLVQKQKWDGKECTITREVDNGQMITTCKCGDVTCRRVYERK